MNSLVSIIVPVYNAEKYLPECIESIMNQTYHNLEIILVDDESTDGSLSICREYSLRDARIRIVEASHQGVVHTRIVGVEAAKGEYCMFVDSDDWIEENMIETILPLASDGVDIVNYSLKSIYETGENEWSNAVPEGVYEKERLEELYKKMMFDFSDGRPGIIQSLCTKLFKRELLWGNIACVDYRITMGEDAAVTYPAMLHSKRVVVTNKSMYCYRVHPGSMCTSRNLNVFSEIYYFQQYMKAAFARYDKCYCLEDQLQAYMAHFIEKGIRDVFSLTLKAVYHIPFYKLPDIRGRLVLYGAGTVGKSYYRQLNQINEIKVVAWIDENEDQIMYGTRISNLKILEKIQFDKILIAVKKETVAQEIRKQLSRYAAGEQIIWEEPQTDRWEKEFT